MLLKRHIPTIVFILAGIGLYIFNPTLIISISCLIFILFIPGFISTYTLFRTDDIDNMERFSFSIGLSISFVVLTLMFSNIYLKIPITTQTVILQVSALCILFTLSTATRRSRAVMSLYTAATNILMLRTEDPKKTLKLIAPLVIVLLLTVNIFYPLVFSNEDEAYEEKYIKYDPSDTHFKDTDKLKISRPFKISFNNSLTFIGYDISQPLKRGERTHINYYFRSEKDTLVQGITVVTDFSIDDNIIFQNQFRFPLMNLAKDDIISLPNDILIPYDLSIGEYSVTVSLFDGYSPLSADSSNKIGTINLPWYFDELYNPSMDVYSFYNGISITAENAFAGKQRVYIFDNNIAFLGYDLDTGAISPGQEFKLTYWWRSLESVDIDYTVFVHFIDSKGRIAFQHDHALARPSSKWIPGDVISEKYDVSVPYVDDDIYRIRFGLYDTVTGERVVLSSRNVKGDAPYLAQITVREKCLSDYYDGDTVRIFNTIDNTLQVDSIELSNPVLVDYGSIVVLGYELDALYCGESANLTYFVKSLGVGGNYSIRTLITDVDGAGVIALDIPIPSMKSGEVAAIVVAVDVPLDYGAGESLFTFGLRDNDAEEYVRGGQVVSESVVVAS